ncbi:hypothetical protein BDY21DRAFT_166386 [Lineolata rhizophorae]|uniref:Uncharacterized protein n=1 Tax=Lineolata rhizophorae TaxID=578093 RepID=A0A6A6P936_9PEZI|nr:hypothetical protein BDY21DRAFT_166386 [Lineolata rhizophorae]
MPCYFWIGGVEKTDCSTEQRGRHCALLPTWSRAASRQQNFGCRRGIAAECKSAARVYWGVLVRHASGEPGAGLTAMVAGRRRLRRASSDPIPPLGGFSSCQRATVPRRNAVWRRGRRSAACRLFSDLGRTIKGVLLQGGVAPARGSFRTSQTGPGGGGVPEAKVLLLSPSPRTPARPLAHRLSPCYVWRVCQTRTLVHSLLAHAHILRSPTPTHVALSIPKQDCSRPSFPLFSDVVFSF